MMMLLETFYVLAAACCGYAAVEEVGLPWTLLAFVIFVILAAERAEAAWRRARDSGQIE